MAIRPGPYDQFSFQVDFGARGVDAGFQEVSGIGTDATPTEYRAGASKESFVRKITGLRKAGEVTLKRGLAGSLALSEWIEQVRDSAPGARRTVTISLRNEDRTAIVQTWTLVNARITKHTSGPFNAKGTDVAVEELVLAYEGLEIV